MIHNRPKKIALIILLIFALVLNFAPGRLSTIGTPITIGTSLLLFIIFYRKKSTFQTEKPKTVSIPAVEISLPRVAQKQVLEDTTQVQIAALGTVHRKQEWQEVETVVDEILDAGIKLIKSRINAFTVAVFFPTIDGGYKLRRYDSPSEHINEGAVIYPGVGVIGGFLKDGLKQLNLHEIMSDSMTLYYYKKDAGIRSLMASTISAGKADRGTIIVDSTNIKNFTDEDHAYVSTVASLMGQAVLNTYLYTEHKLTHVRLAAMSSIEKEFFSNLSLDVILDTMVEVIPFAFSCDRLTLSIKTDGLPEITVKRIWGKDAEWFLNKKFSIKEKTLAGITFSKNMVLCRNFSHEHYEIRFRDDEPNNEFFNSFLAVPIGVDDCKGMVLLESYKPDAFNEQCKELISRISISAGLALEKIILLEKTKTLATRDGLTGLRNHREFQQILNDEITRSIRYNDPLALVICDIDFFKKLNDTWGHQFGDLVLKTISSQLESSIREGIDTAARYGGEEFTLILVKTDEKNAAETTERIRQHIASLVFKTPTGDDIHVTMSFGIALYRQHAKQIDELIKKADKALYRAKDNGRNRVEVFYFDKLSNQSSVTKAQ